MAASRSADPLRNFGFLLKDVSRLYLRNFERHSSVLGLTLAQCKVLGHLQRNEGISQTRLAELTDTDPMTLGRLLDRMQAEGLVERRADPDDKRAHCLHLQSAALPVLESIWQLADRARAESLTGLSAADRAQLMKLMQRIHANLETLLPGVADSHAATPHARPTAKAARTLTHAR